MTDEEFVDRWTFYLTFGTTIYSLVSMAVNVLVLVVLFREKKYSNNAFYTIYKLMLLCDNSSIFVNHLFSVVPALGLMNHFYASREIVVHIFFFFSYCLRTMEGFANFFLCLNRASAMIFPMHHNRIWTRSNLLILFVVQLISGIIVGATSASFKAHWKMYPGYRIYALHELSSGLKTFWFQLFALTALSVILISSIYLIILVRFRLKEFRSLSLVFQTNIDSVKKKKASLLFITIAVISMEIIYCGFMYYFFISHVDRYRFHIDYRIFYTIFFVVTALYSTLPAYLLLLFCSSVRNDALKLIKRNT